MCRQAAGPGVWLVPCCLESTRPMSTAQETYNTPKSLCFLLEVWKHFVQLDLSTKQGQHRHRHTHTHHRSNMLCSTVPRSFSHPWCLSKLLKLFRSSHTSQLQHRSHMRDGCISRRKIVFAILISCLNLLGNGLRSLVKKAQEDEKSLEHT